MYIKTDGLSRDWYHSGLTKHFRHDNSEQMKKRRHAIKKDKTRIIKKIKMKYHKRNYKNTITKLTKILHNYKKQKIVTLVIKFSYLFLSYYIIIQIM